MPLTPSFTIAQTSDPRQLSLVDNSSGSDGAITDRQILIYRTDNSLLVPSIDWPFAQPSITISPLTTDLGINVVVNWNNNLGVPLYTKSLIFAANQFGEQFVYSLIQELTAQPNIANDQNFFSNFSKLITLLDSSNKSISTGNDIGSAQVCISLYQQLIQFPNNYF